MRRHGSGPDCGVPASGSGPPCGCDHSPPFSCLVARASGMGAAPFILWHSWEEAESGLQQPGGKCDPALSGLPSQYARKGSRHGEWLAAGSSTSAHGIPTRGRQANSSEAPGSTGTCDTCRREASAGRSQPKFSPVWICSEALGGELAQLTAFQQLPQPPQCCLQHHARLGTQQDRALARVEKRLRRPEGREGWMIHQSNLTSTATSNLE